MDINSLNNELVNTGLLHKIIYFDVLDSTNKYSRQNELEDNTLIITSHQTNGAGRFKRSWETLRGKNLTFSLVKYFNLQIDEVSLVNFYSSYILCETLKKFFTDNYEINLKWPNDILMNGRKVAGLLLDVKELRSDAKKFTIGIGLNVNQKRFTSDINFKATSLYIETKALMSLEVILINFVKNFYGSLNLLRWKENLVQNWILNSKCVGKKINFRLLEDDLEKEATLINIDSDGGLRLLFSDGSNSKFYSGEISVIYNS